MYFHDISIFPLDPPLPEESPIMDSSPHQKSRPPGITIDPSVRWGTPCLRTTGISVGEVIALQRAGQSAARILEQFAALRASDLEAATEWYRCFGDDGLRPRPPDPTGRHPRISVRHAIQGGLPVVRGTRITVDAICGLAERGAAVDEILEEYPALTRADVSAALRYDSELHG
ncbi:MAG: hypothetical protein NVSMB4_07050 [Acidimicrobiales bacterium]